MAYILTFDITFLFLTISSFAFAFIGAVLGIKAASRKELENFKASIEKIRPYVFCGWILLLAMSSMCSMKGTTTFVFYAFVTGAVPSFCRGFVQSYRQKRLQRSQKLIDLEMVQLSGYVHSEVFCHSEQE